MPDKNQSIGKLGTFQELLDEYSLDLKERGKTKAKEIKQIFEIHVTADFPELVSKPACEITAQDIATILIHVLNKPPKNRGIHNTTPAAPSDKRPTTIRVHTYLRAAFTKAKCFEIAIDGNPIITNKFHLSCNPAEAVRKLDET